MDIDKKLNIEYDRYIFINNLFNIFLDKFNARGKFEYELSNIFERLLLTLINNYIYKYNFKNCKINIHNKAIIKFKNEMYNKLRDFNYTKIWNVNNFVNFFIKEINNFKLSNINRYYFKNNKYIICDVFKVEIDQNYKILENILKNKYNETYIDKVLLIMYIRYECLLPRGQQWNLSQTFFENSIDKYGICFEAFASPKNSQIIRINPDYKFSSLFFDTDYIFGSCGNFFNFDLIKYIKDNGYSSKTFGVIVNPPFIESILNKTANYIILLLNKYSSEKFTGRLRFIINTAYWKNTYFYKKLTHNQYINYLKKMKSGKHYYENNNGKYTKKIKAKFKSCLYVLEYPKVLDPDNYFSEILVGYYNKN